MRDGGERETNQYRLGHWGGRYRLDLFRPTLLLRGRRRWSFAPLFPTYGSTSSVSERAVKGREGGEREIMDCSPTNRQSMHPSRNARLTVRESEDVEEIDVDGREEHVLEHGRD